MLYIRLVELINCESFMHLAFHLIVSGFLNK